MDPARMFKESLTPRPELENSLDPKATCRGALFDHLLGAQQDRCRNLNAQRLGGLEIHR